MALKKTAQTPFGIEIVNAYHRVEGVRIVDKTKIAYQLRSYADVNFSSFNDASFESVYTLEGENPIAQAYKHLKTLSEFESAIDC
jgi:hypothetical protein